MKTALLFVTLALTNPQPAENYYAEISPEIADHITECVINKEYHEYLDFNGDGELNIADIVGVRKRYQDNCKYGNEITLDREVVDSIVMENYSDEAIYWEIDSVNGKPTRQYEITVSEITTAEIYIEFENNSECVTVELNPFMEVIEVKEEIL